MRREEKRTLQFALAAVAICATGAILFPFALYGLGLWLAPPRPISVTRPASQLIRDALWARAEGGRATEIKPINPISLAQFIACHEFAERDSEGRRDDRECREYLPAMPAIELLSKLHVNDAQLAPTPRKGISMFATTVWLSRSWTKTELLDTLAARGDFGYGWRDIDGAARGYFGIAVNDLTLEQAAMIASVMGDRDADPWCRPVFTREMRNRVLTRMHENGAINDAELQEASSRPIEVAAPPATKEACR